MLVTALPPDGLQVCCEPAFLSHVRLPTSWVGAGGHSACSSGLVQLAEPNTCTSATVVWTIWLLGLVLGIVLVLIAVIVWAVRRPG